MGKKLVDEDGLFGGGEWTVLEAPMVLVPYRPGPNPASARKRIDVATAREKGPYVVLAQGAERLWFLPMETDGDVADLWRRVTGERHPKLTGEHSDNYKKVLAKQLESRPQSRR